MSSRAVVQDNSENFKILVATDLHLGFEEKNLVRGENKNYIVSITCDLYYTWLHVIIIIHLSGYVFHDFLLLNSRFACFM